ncbi:MAG TPA: hypothetical protein PLE28_01890 [bacterium]|nr:hypothetical protein [bacterium]
MINFRDNKKIIIIFSLILVILIVVLIFFVFKKNSNNNLSNNPDGISNNSLLKQTSFADRETSIKESLAKKFNISSDQVSVFIGRESENHINGAFFIENYLGTESLSGYFFAVLKNSIDIVWADKGSVDCSIITSYNFPSEMAPECF